MISYQENYLRVTNKRHSSGKLPFGSTAVRFAGSVGKVCQAKLLDRPRHNLKMAKNSAITFRKICNNSYD